MTTTGERQMTSRAGRAAHSPLTTRPGSQTLASLGTGAVATILGVFALGAILHFAGYILAPVTLAIVIGLMFGPIAARLERAGVPAALAAIGIVIAFLGLIAISIVAFAVPLSAWAERLPEIWMKLQAEIRDWKGLISAISQVRDQIREMIGSKAAMTVEVSDGSTVQSAAIVAPAIVGQIVIFLASMYFFLATRRRFRVALLSLCFSRRLRWRVAHVFRDMEDLVSRYLLSITLVNIGLGIAVSLAMWITGVPEPLLWGVMAGMLNYVIYVGPAVMVAVLLCVGLASFSGGAVFMPAAIYLIFNMLEAQVVTPHVIGRNLVLNPFLVFLSIVFWLWLWGPVGGFIAVPILLLLYAVLSNILPMTDFIADRDAAAVPMKGRR